MQTDLLPLRIASNSPAGADPATLIDARAVAALLSLSLRTIRVMDAGGRLPTPLRFGSVVRWRRAEILEWIDSNCPDRRTWNARRVAARR